MEHENIDVLVDGANVVMHLTDEKGKGYTRTLDAVLSELERFELGFFVIFDNGIVSMCDNSSYVKKLEKRRKGFVIPSHREADDYILFLAERVYDCYVLSRDKFAEYRKIYPKLERRRITYSLSEGVLEFKPSLEEVKSRHSKPSSLLVNVNFECSLAQVKKFLALITKERQFERHLRLSSNVLIERKAQDGKGKITVEADYKKVIEEIKVGEVQLVEVRKIKRLKYQSKSGLTKFTWIPYRLNPSLGRLTGHASPRSLIMLAEAGCIHIPSPYMEKRGR